MLPLSGVSVVVTRPAHQAENLCRLIETAGGKAIRFPVIEIGPPQDVEKCQSQFSELAKDDLAIFVSANAVSAALSLQNATQQNWPDALTIAAVGKATAQALVERNLHVTHVALAPFNSEALLALPELQNLTGKRIVIFRGNGGREFLRDKLLQRGAKVEYVECYQRLKPQSDTSRLYAVWEEKQTMPIVVTSNESLKNLKSMVAKKHQGNLLASQLILMSKRTEALSSELGFTKTPVIAAAANDSAILSALINGVKL